MSWSSGKDSAFALHAVRLSGDVDVVGLLTTVTETYERVAMHGVREVLLQAQAERAGLPLIRVPLPTPCSNEVYEERMRSAMDEATQQGVTHVVFGDLYLEDIRRYREDRLAEVDMTPVFPLWGRDTQELAGEMMASGLRAILTCVDPRHLDSAFAGRWFDAGLLEALPSGVDPCGENGEFHTLCVDGPMFSSAIDVAVGDRVTRDGFVFADVTPA